MFLTLHVGARPQVARDAVNDVFSGYHGLVFVYGQTGTGKTHTLCCQVPLGPLNPIPAFRFPCHGGHRLPLPEHHLHAACQRSSRSPRCSRAAKSSD